VFSSEKARGQLYFNFIYEGVSKRFRTESITKQTVTTNARLEATQRVMEAKLTRRTRKIAIKLHLVAVRKFLIHPRICYGSSDKYGRDAARH